MPSVWVHPLSLHSVNVSVPVAPDVPPASVASSNRKLPLTGSKVYGPPASVVTDGCALPTVLVSPVAPQALLTPRTRFAASPLYSAVQSYLPAAGVKVPPVPFF